MGIEWQETRLAEVACISSGKRPPVVRVTPADGCSIPVLGSSGIMGYTNELLYDYPVLVTGRVGTLGQLHRCAGPSWPSDNTLVIIAKNNRINQDFLYYALCTLIGQAVRLNRGSSNPLITQRDLGALSILVPPLDHQRAIVHVLGTLDDKIELNRRINETLEAIVRVIFKSWFVDFDPVIDNSLKAGKPIPDRLEARAARRREVLACAQAEDRLVGLPDHLARLFPDEFEESELGCIPKGWRVRTLKDMACVTSGKRPKSRSDIKDDTHRVPLFGGGGPMGYVEVPLYEQPIIITGRVGTLGMVFRVTFPCWPSDNTLVIIPHKALLYEYIFHTVQGFDFESLNRGSTQPLVTQSDLESQFILAPSSEALDAFHRFASPIYQKVDLNNTESYTLAAIRDVLLPKLISGDLRVPNAKCSMEEAL